MHILLKAHSRAEFHVALEEVRVRQQREADLVVAELGAEVR